ncbi:MAG: tail fiber domain-containing protein [Pseudomonadota bacterium]|nr:tail fiber domain-containing protein [Pseudomonadota bacterium]
MALRFAGSRMRAPQAGGYGGAAANAQLAEIFNELSRKSPDYAGMAANSLAAQGALERADMDIRIKLHQAGIAGEYGVEAAKIQADAMKEAAAAQKSGATKGGIFRALGAVAGAAIPLLSDETTKTQIEPIENALEILRNLKPVSFHYNEDYSCTPERLHYGFIAQDYAKVMPDATYYDESINKLAIDRGELIGLLVRAIQQLESRITRMEAKQALKEVK